MFQFVQSYVCSMVFFFLVPYPISWVAKPGAAGYAQRPSAHQSSGSLHQTFHADRLRGGRRGGIFGGATTEKKALVFKAVVFKE